MHHAMQRRRSSNFESRFSFSILSATHDRVNGRIAVTVSIALGTVVQIEYLVVPQVLAQNANDAPVFATIDFESKRHEVVSGWEYMFDIAAPVVSADSFESP